MVPPVNSSLPNQIHLKSLQVQLWHSISYINVVDMDMADLHMVDMDMVDTDIVMPWLLSKALLHLSPDPRT